MFPVPGTVLGTAWGGGKIHIATVAVRGMADSAEMEASRGPADGEQEGAGGGSGEGVPWKGRGGNKPEVRGKW